MEESLKEEKKQESLKAEDEEELSSQRRSKHSKKHKHKHSKKHKNKQKKRKHKRKSSSLSRSRSSSRSRSKSPGKIATSDDESNFDASCLESHDVASFKLEKSLSRSPSPKVNDALEKTDEKYTLEPSFSYSNDKELQSKDGSVSPPFYTDQDLLERDRWLPLSKSLIADENSQNNTDSKVTVGSVSETKLESVSCNKTTAESTQDLKSNSEIVRDSSTSLVDESRKVKALSGPKRRSQSRSSSRSISPKSRKRRREIRSTSRNRSSKSRSLTRSSSREKKKSRKKSRSRSSSRSQSRSPIRKKNIIKDRKRSRSRDRKRSRSRDRRSQDRRSRSRDRRSRSRDRRSRSRDRRSRSRDQRRSRERRRSRIQERRSRSRSKSRTPKRGSHRSRRGSSPRRANRDSSFDRRSSRRQSGYRRSRSSSPRKRTSRRSRSPSPRKRSSRRSRSLDRRCRARSRSLVRRGYRDRSRSKSRSRRSRSRSYSSRRRRSSTRSRSKSRDRSRKRSRSRSADSDNKINVKTTETGTPVANIAVSKELIGKAPTVSDPSNKKSLAMLTEFCKKLTEARGISENEEKVENANAVKQEEEDEEENISHPFLVAPKKDITIPQVIFPVKPVLPPVNLFDSSKPLMEQFPVSCGTKHHEKEAEDPSFATIPEVNGSAALQVQQQQQQQQQTVFHQPQMQEKLDISSLVVKRIDAQRRLQANANDVDAMLALQEIEMKLNNWCQSNVKPGQFTGQLAKQMMPKEKMNTGYQAWAKKDMFQNLNPVSGGIGMKLLQKMGWAPGQVLGKSGKGMVEPIALPVKVDRKGLSSTMERPVGKKGGPVIQNINAKTPMDLQGKHPISLLQEYCARRKWNVPEFTLIFDEGPPHSKQFLFKVLVNGWEYQHPVVSGNKKNAKAQAAVAALKGLGLVAEDAQF